jgi:hypothetical protein
MKIIFFLLLFVNLSFAQFETPLVTKTELLQESDLVEDERIKLSCRVFNFISVVEKLEPGFVGNSIYIKSVKDKKEDAKKEECNDIKLENYNKVETQGTVLWGVKENYLFLKDADELSARTKFEVFNLEDNNLLFSGIRNNDLLFKIEPIGNKKYALEYFQMYNVACDLSDEKGNKKCWANFLKQIQEVNDSKEKKKEIVNLPFPKCPDSKNKKKFQVFLKVQIPNLEKKKRKILFSKPVCEIAP